MSDWQTIRSQALEDYDKAQELGLTKIDRWEQDADHHDMSMRLMYFLKEHDYHDQSDYFCWKTGGDGDNGETLMYELDAFFELLDKKHPEWMNCFKKQTEEKEKE